MKNLKMNMGNIQKYVYILLLFSFLTGCALKKANSIEGDVDLLNNRKIALAEFIITPPKAGAVDPIFGVITYFVQKYKLMSISKSLKNLYENRIDNFVDILLQQIKQKKHNIIISSNNGLNIDSDFLVENGVKTFQPTINIAGFNEIVIGKNGPNYFNF